MDIVEKLLGYDPNEIKTLEKVHTMSLKKLGGESFDFPLKALTTEQACTIQDEVFRFIIANGDTEMENQTYKAKVKTLILGCKDVFANPQLQKHFGVTTAEKLISKLLTPGEIDVLKNEIDELSGYDKEEVPTDATIEENLKN